MSVLFTFILNMVFVSFVQSDPPHVICAYQGAVGNGSFKLEDVPNRCQVVSYGSNYFNIEPAKEDEDAITALKSAGKTVYTTYLYEKDNYPGINLYQIALENNTRNIDEYMAPMINFLKKKKIDGVLFAYLGLHDGFIPHYAQKINEFICKVKKLVPSIKVGIILGGFDYDLYTKTNLFDFTITNTNVDLYVIDTSSIGAHCNQNTTATGGTQPIESTTKGVGTLRELREATSNSAMDKSKLVVNINLLAIQVDSSGSESMQSYSKYCKRPHGEVWCGDSMKILYDKVQYLKKLFKGIMMSYTDTDDMDNTCGCGKYPVTNTYIDSFQDKSIKCCDAIA